MLQDILDAIVSKKISKIVSCPAEPIAIPGIGAGAEGAGDCLGTLVEIDVPPSGIIYSATFFDLDDEGTQVDLEIFKHLIAQIADNAPWDLPTAEACSFVTELAFVSFDDHLSSQTSELTNIGKAYTAPEGKLWIQAVCRGTPTIVTTPKFQLQIIPDDPNWKER